MNVWTHLIERPTPPAPRRPPANGHAARHLPPVANPFGLKPRECQVMDATCKHGTAKATGEALGLLPKSIECYWYEIRKKMDAPNMVLAAVKWDRFSRESTGRAT